MRSLSHETINGALLKEMILAGAARLEKNRDEIDKLNVFPVPDGDTGTNMNMTMSSAVKEISAVQDLSVKNVAKALATGSLRGARGNSGVILSQIFRGFSRELEKADEITVDILVAALEGGVTSAYKAVMRPKEGTMLTVARFAAEQAKQRANMGATVMNIIETVVNSSQEILAKTPDMLPVLKQAGVVDAGGKGLLLIYKGFKAALLGEKIEDYVLEQDNSNNEVEHDNQDVIRQDVNDIMFAYCTEFFIQRMKRVVNDSTLDSLRNQLEELGDSIVVAGDDQLIKVHVHTNKPGSALELALKLGELEQVKIENMLEQNRQLNGDMEQQGEKEYALISVVMGDGFVDIMNDLSVDKIICCEQTMNPSIEEIVKAIEAADARSIFVFPNNKNVFLAAQQAAEQIVEQYDKQVYVVPTYSIPQGIGGVLAFHAEVSFEENRQRIDAAIEEVHSGYITYAVRDSVMDDKSIKKGDYLGIGNGQLLEVGADLNTMVFDLLKQLVQDPEGIITVYYGQDVTEEDAQKLVDSIEQAYPYCDVDMYHGGQALYYYILSVE